MTCTVCGHTVVRLCGRGLCRACWKRANADGTLADHSPSRRTVADLIAEVEWIAGTDTAESITRRLGYSRPGTLFDTLARSGRWDLVQRLRGMA